MNEMPMVRFDNVSKRYGALTVLDSLNLDIGRGEKVSIIGPSGSGKTTVLRMLMTLESINDGVLWVDGEPMTHVQKGGQLVPADAKHIRKIRGKIGMVFQSFNLFPHMTAIGNCIEAPMTVLGLKRAEAEERAAELLDMVGLSAKKIITLPSCREDSSNGLPSPVPWRCAQRSCYLTRSLPRSTPSLLGKSLM